MQGSGVQRVQGYRGHRGAGIRDARSVRHKGAELRVQRVQGSGGAEGESAWVSESAGGAGLIDAESAGLLSAKRSESAVLRGAESGGGAEGTEVQGSETQEV